MCPEYGNVYWPDRKKIDPKNLAEKKDSLLG